MHNASSLFGRAPNGRTLLVAGSTSALMIAAASSIYAISALGPYFVEVGLATEVGYSLFPTLVFLAAAALSLTLNRHLDDLSDAFLATASFGLVLAYIAAIAVAKSPVLLGFACVLAGGAIASANPATNRAIDSNVHADTVGLVTGVKQGGAQLGAVVVGFILVPLGSSWEDPPLAMVLLSLLLLPALPLVMLDGPRKLGHRSPATSTLASHSGGLIYGRPRVVTAYSVLLGIGVSSVLAYLPLSARFVGDITVKEAGLVVGVLGAVSALARVGIGSVLSPRRIKGAMVSLATVAAATAGLLAMASPRGLVAYLAAAAMFGASANAWITVGMYWAMQRSGEVASSSARVIGTNALGLAIGAPLFATAIHFASYRVAWTIVGVVLSAGGGVALSIREYELEELLHPSSGNSESDIVAATKEES